MVNKDGTPPRKGTKSPSKLLSPKYQSQSSLGEQNKNLTSPKCAHFVNTIIVLCKDDKPGEKGIVKPGTKDDDRDTIVKIKEECKESEEKGKEENDDPENINANPPSPPDPSISFITEKVRKLNLFLESLNLVPPLSDTEFVCAKENDGDVMFIEIIKNYGDSSEEELGEDESVVTGELEVEYFDIFLTRSELTYHKYLMCAPILSLFLRNTIIVGGRPSNLKIPCNIGHMHVEKAYIDLNSHLNVMTQISNMARDLSLGVVKFSGGTNEIAYNMAHMIEQYKFTIRLGKRAHEVILLQERGGQEKRSRVRDE
ncbi:hypothetical protein Tco_0367290 [Tanacetum coccineum]